MENNYQLRTGFRKRSRKEDFWVHVRKTKKCWLWFGSIGLNGYGDFVSHYKRQLAHRYSWELHYGKIPKEKFVCHTCDIRNCVRPKHLWIGSLKENVRDMWNKNRQSAPPIHYGEKNVNAKMTVKIVREIRKQHGKVLNSVLMKKYGISKSTVWGIVYRKIWKHVA